MESPALIAWDDSEAPLVKVSDLKNSGASDQAIDAISKKQPVNDLLDGIGLDERPSSSDNSFITAMSDLDIGSSPAKVAEDVATKLDAVAAESKSGENWRCRSVLLLLLLGYEICTFWV